MRRLCAALILALALPWTPAAAQRCADVVPGQRPQNADRDYVGQTYDEIIDRGFVEFAVYEDFPPYSWQEDGAARGVDVALGEMIAEALGVEPRFRFVPAGETLEADLRTYVWQGGVIGGRVSNVMLHVPYNSTLVCRVEQVVFTGQYYNEKIAIAYATSVYPDKPPKPAVFRFETVGVENDSLSDFYLSNLANGQVIPKMRRFRTPEAAMAALRAGEVTAVMGARAQLEHGLAEGLALSDANMPGLGVGEWTVGAAVHMSHRDLAYAVDDAIKAAAADGRLAAVFEAHGLSFHPAQW